MQHIIFDRSDSIATITFNRPKSYNSFHRAMALEVQAALDQCQDESIRVVVLMGNGKAFSAGQDLQEVSNPDAYMGFRKILEEHYAPIVLKIQALEKPVIAAVNGVAAGAGANIALCCDLVLASEKASFLQAFSRIGLIPDSAGTYFLPRLVGYQKALGLAMLAEQIDAKEAERLGMIYKIFPDETFQSSIRQIAEKLSKMPTKGLGLLKQAYQKSMSNTLEEQLVVENELQIIAASTDDYREGVQAFLQKRKPIFKGK
ncbi:MAG: enoyl-CoA hydratase-related protein [Bacteroidota bacterium]